MMSKVPLAFVLPRNVKNAIGLCPAMWCQLCEWIVSGNRHGHFTVLHWWDIICALPTFVILFSFTLYWAGGWAASFIWFAVSVCWVYYAVLVLISYFYDQQSCVVRIWEWLPDCQSYTARLSIALFVPALTVMTVVSDSSASTVNTGHLESCVHDNAVLCQVFKLSHVLISTPPVAQGEVWPGHGLSTSVYPTCCTKTNSGQAMVCQWVSTLPVAQGEVWPGNGLSMSIDLHYSLHKEKSDRAMICQWGERGEACRRLCQSVVDGA